MVGHDVCAALESRGETVLALTKSHLDITDAAAVRDVVRRTRPDIIVNCAAYTKVDDAEANEHLATAINGSAVEFLADAANDAGALLVQLSTDFVFDGTNRTPYEVNDVPAPLSAYGRSKLVGEQAASMARKYLIIRTAWLFGVHGPNFVEAIRRSAKERIPCASSTISEDGRRTRRISPTPSSGSRNARGTTRTRAASSTTPMSRSAPGSTSRARSLATRQRLLPSQATRFRGRRSARRTRFCPPNATNGSPA
jgi:nucleoside-diphosphate-sugar epimerase